ncbi:hypothetical protein [Daejeonella lutea]|uniref:Caspase domain-containing protein n=1 Tax=Daejeonella lutea TaxID=572036 RepID=A0A1T5B0X0_9SPHI|nr:hypothetical protein [Daejeonella lutea]SKB40707.1 hypothetical protein SAMN05661099_1176 [Daejeonella lutea]
MRKIIFNFLGDSDLDLSSYESIKDLLIPYEVIKCDSTEVIFETLNQVNTDNESLMLTFLGHGANEDGLVSYQVENRLLLLFEDLLPEVNTLRTNNPVILNLVANCNSYRCEGYLSPDNRIDNIWVTTTHTDSISRALVAIRAETFDFFLEDLEDDSERARYRLIS